MRDLYKIFFESNTDHFQKVYANRKSFDSTVVFDLMITPINQSNTFNLYYVPTEQIILLISNIYKIAQQINEISYRLPDLAKEQFVLETLVDELYHTNEIEGVKSSRAEIVDSVKSIQRKKDQKIRFDSMITAYYRLINKDYVLPESLWEVRHIYDEIIKGEVAKKELPDGEIFRKGITYVYKRTGSGKVIHRGVMPEQQIHEKLKQLLHFMNQDDGIPPLIKVAVGHFYFGYIHPFYDGNGRTARFISSMYLEKELGPLASLSLSQGCHKFSRLYLKSFEITNSFVNQGEMNYFINSFLEIILNTLEDMYFDLREKHELLKIASKKISEDRRSQDLAEKYQEVLFILAQDYFFKVERGLTVDELTKIIKVSKPTMRMYLQTLIDLSLIETEGKRPIYYKIKQQFLEQ